jgi:hypothetical protein
MVVKNNTEVGCTGMETFRFSHLGGDDELPEKEADELREVLGGCQIPVSRGYGPALRNEVLEELRRRGWTGAVKVAHGSKITIASQKNRVGLCIQTSGNMSRMYADLIKLQQMYLNNTIRVGVFVLPTALAARELGDNVANSDRLQSELQIFRKVIHMPLTVISFQ